MVGGVETSREGGATQESVMVEFEEFIVSCDGGGSMPRQRNMKIYQHVHVHVQLCTCTLYFLYQHEHGEKSRIWKCTQFCLKIRIVRGSKTGSERHHFPHFRATYMYACDLCFTCSFQG